MTVTIPTHLLPESVDRLLAIDPGVRGTAVRNVPSTLPLLDSHFPRFAVLPGVLLLQSMAAVARLVAGGDDWHLRSAHTVRFRRFVRPGDHVVIHASVITASAGVTELAATAEVDGQVVAVARRLVLRRDTGVRS
jgi:3-hydroxyacyl-[acyl-carrier-protein] dehydratase